MPLQLCLGSGSQFRSAKTLKTSRQDLKTRPQDKMPRSRSSRTSRSSNTRQQAAPYPTRRARQMVASSNGTMVEASPFRPADRVGNLSARAAIVHVEDHFEEFKRRSGEHFAALTTFRDDNYRYVVVMAAIPPGAQREIRIRNPRSAATPQVIYGQYNFHVDTPVVRPQTPPVTVVPPPQPYENDSDDSEEAKRVPRPFENCPPRNEDGTRSCSYCLEDKPAGAFAAFQIWSCGNRVCSECLPEFMNQASQESFEMHIQCPRRCQWLGSLDPSCLP